MKARSAEPPFTISPVDSLRVLCRITEDFGDRHRNSLGSSRLGSVTLSWSKAEVAYAPLTQAQVHPNNQPAPKASKLRNYT